MRNILRERFDALPESQQHLARAIGAGGVSAAMFGYAVLVDRLSRQREYDNAFEALADGLDRPTKLIVSVGGSAMWASIAAEELKAFQGARQVEAEQSATVPQAI